MGIMSYRMKSLPPCSYNSQFYRNHCIYLPSMLGWFTFSVLLSLYNKKVFGKDHLAFPCPLLLTSIHFFIQWIFSWMVSELAPETFGGIKVKHMEWSTFLKVGIPCGLVTSLDVGLSNLSLVRISLTFYTMIKASTPIFVLAWAFIFGIEHITKSLVMVVSTIAAGEFLTVLGEVRFDWIGFGLVVSASVLSGARWTLVQLLLSKIDPPLQTSIATMRVLSPSMFGSMILISLVVEQPWNQLQSGYFDSVEQSFHTIALALGGATLAICMVLFEFSLIMKSNAIVLMIGGVMKEMLTILMGVTLFDDELNVINVGGMIVVFCGVVAYKVYLHVEQMEQEQLQLSENENGKGVNYRPVDKDTCNGNTHHNEEEEDVWMTLEPLDRRPSHELELTKHTSWDNSLQQEEGEDSVVDDNGILI